MIESCKYEFLCYLEYFKEQLNEEEYAELIEFIKDELTKS